MPAEKFYGPDATEAGGCHIAVRWGETPEPGVFINGEPYDRSALNRLIRALRRARDQVYDTDE